MTDEQKADIAELVKALEWREAARVMKKWEAKV